MFMQPGIFRIIASGFMVYALHLSQNAYSSTAESCDALFKKTDYSSARNVCQEYAEQGNAMAAYLLATIYYKGLATEPNEQRGIFWDKIAAEKGHPDSAYRLALLYQLGQGTLQNNAEARRWYIVAAMAGHAKAQKQLGIMFESGDAGEVDYAKAFAWFKKAAQQGETEAQFRTGKMLLEGRGVESDRAHAQHWIRKAAEAGHNNAQLAYGVLLSEIDPVESFYWYEKSASKGNVMALYNMALAYYSGQGVAKDLVKAKELAQQAVVAGHKDVDRLLLSN